MVRLVHLVRSMMGGMATPIFARQADPRLGHLPGEDDFEKEGLNRLPQGDFTEEALETLARQLLDALGCPELARQVRVRWNRRLRTTAGLANYHSCSVSLNPRLTIFGMEEVDRTLRHELAHFALFNYIS